MWYVIITLVLFLLGRYLHERECTKCILLVLKLMDQVLVMSLWIRFVTYASIQNWDIRLSHLSVLHIRKGLDVITLYSWFYKPWLVLWLTTIWCTWWVDDMLVLTLKSQWLSSFPFSFFLGKKFFRLVSTNECNSVICVLINSDVFWKLIFL